jgi:hypothetical protein
MLPDTGIDDVKKQRNADYAKHINDPVLSSLKMEGIRLLFYLPLYIPFSNVFYKAVSTPDVTNPIILFSTYCMLDILLIIDSVQCFISHMVGTTDLLHLSSGPHF